MGGYLEKKKVYTYDEISEKIPNFKDVISSKSWEHISASDDKTVEVLRKLWLDNMERNVKSKRYKRNGPVRKDCVGLGRNKATICVGAGPSLKKNYEVFRRLHDLDGMRHPDNRDFIIIASNHMFKPLLNDGIIPDFVFLTDASDVVKDQLTKDIPESGRNVVLLSGLQCDPGVLKRWCKQGREIRFYLTMTPGIPEKFEELTGEKREDVWTLQGGNVMNTCWSVALRYFHSTVFMALGNDLSYPIDAELDKRRNTYYVDGDYSSNLGTGRDEAISTLNWLSFGLEDRRIITNDKSNPYNVKLDLVHTTGTLWVYKTWIEAQMLASTQSPVPNYYYNCSEGGICGVMHKDDSAFDDINNWYLMDKVCPKWKTKKLRDAVVEFLVAKEGLERGKRKMPTMQQIR